jgi:D-psicose/D-tagatose/L-ribulose 3-epimerase
MLNGRNPGRDTRVRFGCCGSMIAPATDPIGIEVIETMAELGFDYIELSLAHLAALEEGLCLEVGRRVERSGLRCEACNNFFPAAVRLTGADARLDAALEYADRALDRAAALGARVVVFGSSGAKNVPAGFDHPTAWRQIVGLLRRLGPMAASRGLTIAIEPLNKLESNIVNLAAEGLRLAAEVAHPQVGLLIDYYHLAMEREDPAILVEAGPVLRHLHLARADGRRFPRELESAGMAAFFDTIRSIRYTGRCSIEAYTDDFATDARQAIAFLRAAMDFNVKERSL